MNNPVHEFDYFTKYCFEHADNIWIVKGGKVKTISECSDEVSEITNLWHGTFAKKVENHQVPQPNRLIRFKYYGSKSYRPRRQSR